MAPSAPPMLPCLGCCLQDFLRRKSGRGLCWTRPGFQDWMRRGILSTGLGEEKLGPRQER
jgi:hypothetical protein